MKKAVIFDMDGVISDTQKYHAIVESKLLQRFNIEMSPAAITERYAGVADEIMFAQIFADHNIKNVAIAELVVEKWKLMQEVSHDKLEAIPHAIKLVLLLKEADFKLAIASASTVSFITHVLDTLAIRHHFDTIASAQEVANGKPAPDIFLLAAKRLSVSPHHAVVVEDGRSGMIGAKAANIKCVGLVGDITADYPADLLVTSLDQVTLEKIHSL